MKLILVLSLFSLWHIGIDYEKESLETQAFSQKDIKTVAFKILTMKCNVCHVTKKKRDIFTLENMDSLASDIHKQVFIKKKMPKGRKNNLSEQESSALKNWLDFVLKE